MLASTSHTVLRTARRRIARTSGANASPSIGSSALRCRQNSTTAQANTPLPTVSSDVQPQRTYNFVPDTSYRGTGVNTAIARYHMKLSQYAEEKRPIDAMKVALVMKKQNIKPDLTAYNYILDAVASHGYAQEAWGIVADMEAMGIKPDITTCHHLLNAHRFVDSSRMWPVLELMERLQLAPTAKTYTFILERALAQDNPEHALRYLREMELRDLQPELDIAQQVIIHLANKSHVQLAFDLAVQFDARSVRRLASELWVNLLIAAAETLNKDITLKCWDVVVHDHHIILDEGLCMAVLNTAARHGLPSLAADVLSMLDTISVPVQEHHYASIIEALIKGNQLQEAIAALRLMETHGITPLETTARPIVDAICKSTAKLDETWTILDTLHAQDERGVSVIAINVYINAALLRGDLQRAVGIYKAAPGYNVSPDVETFNLLLHGCVQAGHRELGDRFLQEMRAAGVKPDIRTYENMIWLCLSQSTYEDAFFYLEEMKGQGFLPGLKVYEGIVKRCVAQGDTRYTIALEEMKECGYKVSPELRKFIDRGGSA